MRQKAQVTGQLVTGNIKRLFFTRPENVCLAISGDINYNMSRCYVLRNTCSYNFLTYTPMRSRQQPAGEFIY